MLRIAALLCFASFAVAGDKGQAAKPQDAKKPVITKGQDAKPIGKGQDAIVKPANKVIVEQKTTEYAPVPKRRRLIYRAIGISRSIGEVCPNCAK